jgi:hypothetical protein
MWRRKSRRKTRGEREGEDISVIFRVALTGE